VWRACERLLPRVRREAMQGPYLYGDVFA
jgi:hypothetical protein